MRRCILSRKDTRYPHIHQDDYLDKTQLGEESQPVSGEQACAANATEWRAVSGPLGHRTLPSCTVFVIGL